MVAVTRRSWRPLAAPALFLLAATIAILLVRGTVHHGSVSAAKTATTAAPTRPKHTPPHARRLVYTVRAGDTLSAIAAQTGVTLARIRVLNPKLEPTALFIGEKIRLR